MSRKLAREVAMKLAFARLLGGENDYRHILEQTGIAGQPSDEDVAFADDLIEGIEKHQAALDEMIDKSAIGWSIERLPKVDLCILRIALYEMQFRQDIPPSVSINEAVELAKRFADDKSPAYINGILGTLAKELENS